LISFTLGNAAYGEALFLGLGEARQGVQTHLVPFREAVARLRPHLVISDGAVAAPGAAKARIAAEPTERTEPSTMRPGGVVRTVVNPAFEYLLAFVDDVARAVGESRQL
jgi:hypothetical protein